MDAVKLLGSLMGNNATGGNVLGSLLGGATGGGGGGGGLGSIVGSLLSGGGGATGGGGGGLGSLLGGMLGGGGGAPQPQARAARPTGRPSVGQLGGAERQQAESDATLLIRAMVNAAKADGQIDKAEIQNIVSRLGDQVDKAEAAFLQQELQAPLDIAGYCRSVPQHLSQQAYAFSLMGMKLDTKQEAQYLGAMAQGLGLNPQICNAIHDQLGAPQIFR